MIEMNNLKDMNIAIVPANWVKPDLLPFLFGLTKGAADKKRQRGEWLEEKHYRKAPDNNFVYNWRQIEKWYGGEI